MDPIKKVTPMVADCSGILVTKPSFDHIGINLKASIVFILQTKETTPRGTLDVKPYARKWDTELMKKVTPVVADCSGPDGCPQKYTPCANMRMVPAVIFAGGGFTNR